MTTTATDVSMNPGKVNGRDTDYVLDLVSDKLDPVLGQHVHQHLIGLGLDSPREDAIKAAGRVYQPKVAYEALKQGIYTAYKNLGLDVDCDPSLMDTPKRFAAMFVGELTKGLNYDFFPKCTATPNGVHDAGVLVGAYDQMVRVEKIQTVSLCEHHLQTIDGFTHVAYIPASKVLGLSKFARVTDFFAARPQIQERMTEQIYASLCFILGTEDVAVVQKAKHFCMHARGARQHQSITTTDRMGGRFLTNASLRQEFFHGID